MGKEIITTSPSLARKALQLVLSGRHSPYSLASKKKKKIPHPITKNVTFCVKATNKNILT